MFIFTVEKIHVTHETGREKEDNQKRLNRIRKAKQYLTNDAALFRDGQKQELPLSNKMS